MTAAMTSFTSSSKALRAALVALALVALANVWVGLRVPGLIAESPVDMAIELDRRVAAVPDKGAVKVLVFGSSHAIAAMRPPVLAEALGVSPNAIFNFGQLGASAFESLLLAERYAARFPNARAALVPINECLLGFDTATRTRYLTRGAWHDRWRYAMHQATLDERLGLLAGFYLPVADFGVALKEALAKRPVLMLRRLVADAPIADSNAAYFAAMAYPWGLPPPWTNPKIFSPRENVTEPAFVKHRADVLLEGQARVGAGFGHLEALARLLERRGMRVALMRTPYLPALEQELATRPAHAEYARRLGAYMAESRRELLAAPASSDPRDYHDLDHLSEQGARRYLAGLGDRLGWVQQVVKPRPAAAGRATTARKLP
jgi:hypothetical protein